jgi:hypothetical protein
MATGNSRVLIGEEVKDQWGVVGASPTGYVLRRTYFKVDPSRPELTSGEMRSDPFRAPSRMGATEIKGEFGFEVVPGAHDVIMAAILHNEWNGETLKAGAGFVPKSLFIEHLTFGRHILYTGVALEKVGLSFEPNGIVKGSASFLAKERREGANSAAATIVDAPDTLASASWDGVFEIDGERSKIMTALTIDITRTVNMRAVLGEKFPQTAHLSKFDVTGSMTIRPQDTGWWRNFQNEEERMKLEVTISGIAGSDRPSYKFTLPRLLLTSAPEDLSDPEDLLIELPFAADINTAAADPADRVPLIITRTV